MTNKFIIEIFISYNINIQVTNQKAHFVVTTTRTHDSQM